MADAPEPAWVSSRWEGFVVGTAAGITTTFVAFAIVLALSWFGVIGGSDATGGVPTTIAPSGPPRGEEVALVAGCAACHSVDGSQMTGPSWLGIAGTDRPIEGGGTVLADSAYLHQSIVDPRAVTVAGFPDVMPTHFGDTLSQAQIDALVIYIESLG